MKIRNLLLCVASIYLVAAPLHAKQIPNKSVTPGKLCSENDDDFEQLDYPERIARCTRNVSKAEKSLVANEYDVPESDWANYEFDHLIPLCAGGANDSGNLWPQPLDEAKEKDKVEDDVCRKMKAGTMTQEQAVQEIWDWFDEKVSSFAPLE